MKCKYAFSLPVCRLNTWCNEWSWCFVYLWNWKIENRDLLFHCRSLNSWNIFSACQDSHAKNWSYFGKISSIKMLSTEKQTKQRNPETCSFGEKWFKASSKINTFSSFWHAEIIERGIPTNTFSNWFYVFEHNLCWWRTFLKIDFFFFSSLFKIN